MSEIVIISGSPQYESRSELVLKFLGRLLEEKGARVTHLSVRDVPQTVLFEAAYDSEVIGEIAGKIRGAKGVIIGSPVYKAAYSGVLKALIDLLPQDILEGKPVLPIMTGGSKSHLLALEFSLKPLLSTLKGQSLKGVYLTDIDIDKERPIPILDIDTLQRTKKQLSYFLEIAEKQNASLPEYHTV